MDVRAEFVREHNRRLHQWFDAAGNFRAPGTPASSRERLWNCCSLFQGTAAEVRLANRIICATPVDHNHFEPVIAVELLLRYPKQLTPASTAHLTRMAREHLLNLFEFRFGSAEAHNFTCMGTWFLLAASQVLDGYEWKHPLGSIPAVYTKRRIHDIGMNSLYALSHLSEHRPVFSEWNSPTYTPISLHCMAKIVELIDEPEAKQLALEIELKLWREVLAFYHPELSLSCGPWSRAYRCDMLGQSSQMRVLLAYVGVSKDHSVVDVFDETQKDLLFHHDGDIPFCWSGPAWQMAGKFHVPTDALREVKRRKFPRRVDFPVQWGPSGHVDPVTKKYISVQGTAVAGGEAVISQIQRKRSALGYRSRTVMGTSFPINFHYALVPTVRSMRDVRIVTAAVVFRDTPVEWVKDQTGQPIESSGFNTEGQADVTAAKQGLAFSVRQLPGLATMASRELSLNTFIPLHFVPVAEVTLNGRRFEGEVISIRARQALCRVVDAGVVYEIEYEFPRPVMIRLYRWAKFIRFAGFWYAGAPRRITPTELNGHVAKGRFSIIRER